MSKDLMLGRTNRDWSCGSMLLPAKQEQRLRDKIDDVRYDVRRVGRNMAIAVGCLSAAVGLLGIAGIYSSSKQ